LHPQCGMPKSKCFCPPSAEAEQAYRVIDARGDED
jgi:hypothetical protein